MAGKKATEAAVESALVEVIQNVEKSAKVATVYINEARVDFVDGVAKVTEDVAKALKDAGLVK